MNRNTILGTLGVSLLLILMGMVSQSQTPRRRKSNLSHFQLAAAETTAKPIEMKKGDRL